MNSPDYIQFYPTLRCNFSCNFCFNQKMPVCEDIKLSDFKKIIGRLSGLKVKTIDIMGGEPTLHKDIIPMIEYAVEKGFHLNISSNGTNTEILLKLIRRFKEINVGISINKREMLKKLKNFIKTYSPTVKTIFFNDIDVQLVNWIPLLKPIRFYLIYPDIMTKNQIKNAVSFPQFLISAQRLSANLSLTGTVYCSGFIPDTIKYPALSKKRCPAGTTKLGIMPDGSVYPCNLFFGIKEFKLGNLIHDRFENIWSSKRLDFFRDFKGNLCPETECILHKSCNGGCPAHSYIHRGNLHSPEPRCVRPDRHEEIWGAEIVYN